KEDAARWAALTAMHHGRPHFSGIWQKCERSIGGESEAWEAVRRGIAEELAALWRVKWQPPLPAPPEGAWGWWLAGLISVADWIGSDERFFSAERATAPAEHVGASMAAQKALSTIGLHPLPRLPERSFFELFGFPPNDLQTKAMQSIQSPGVYVIEAPMGMGKTEAALAAAYGLLRVGTASGIYFALPTQATSNRIHERVASFLTKIGCDLPRLIHSGSWLMEKDFQVPRWQSGQPDDSRRYARDWFGTAKRALLAPFGVGTVDQALMGVIAVKHFFIRHYALAGKVVILDEVHSYDVFTGTLVEALVEALSSLGCTVIILSATLTMERRAALLRRGGGTQPLPESRGFPLITSTVHDPVPVDPPAVKPPVKLRFREESECLREAVEAVRAGARVLWICNTVDCAQATYHAICGERCEGDPPVGLLHSRFTFADRERLEQEWMKKLGKERDPQAGGCLLVSTQIVEQSVDLDADLLITELAPTDMLFQRMGRLWRHWEKDQQRCRAEPETWILREPLSLQALREAEESQLSDALGKKARVYAPYVLLRTLQHWHDQPVVRLPDDIRDWLEATYEPRDDDPPAWKCLLKQMEDQRKSHLGRAETAQNLWNLPTLEDEEGIGTRLNTCETLPLVLISTRGEGSVTLHEGQTLPVQDLDFDFPSAKALHRNLVKAPAWWFADKRRCLDHLSRAEAAFLKKHLHGDFEAGELDGLRVTAAGLGETQLEYSPSFGLIKLKQATLTKIYDWEDDDSYD
ncbi:MAG: CRISPR-associated helicase Cas3', partial [Prosthecobacter sp.]|nr:CRISPR-associated helicase Cas3' [Prosthecobacter sp.]